MSGAGLSGLPESSATAVLGALAEEIQTGWAAQNGARVVVAEDPVQEQELLLAGSPNGATVVLSFRGDAPADDFGAESNNVAVAQFGATVSSAQGLRVSDSTDAPGALAKAESLRAWIFSRSEARGMVEAWRYAGMQPTTTYGAQGAALRAYTITFSGIYAWGWGSASSL